MNDVERAAPNEMNRRCGAVGCTELAQWRIVRKPDTSLIVENAYRCEAHRNTVGNTASMTVIGHVQLSRAA
ncbi:MAG: hypothetical protein JHC95_12545 [Solirubrobacteraceae bacterium]|nr:hypothetical protein [Solirubrobacteraceae bacterium]